MQTTTRPGMPLTDYMRRYDEEGPFEILDGEIIPMSPTKFGHNYLTKLVFLALHNFTAPGGEWEAFVETPFIMPGIDDPNWVEGSLVPDVMVVNIPKLTSYKAITPDWREKPLSVVPDLVVEIISPTDHYSDVIRKVERYFERGVQIVWLLDQQRRKVTAYVGSIQQQTVLNDTQTLTADSLLPGFSMTIKSLFE